MNVSFTRARSKLVIFGSRKTLQREPLLAQFFELMQGRGWILQLPPGAHIAHERVLGSVITTTPTRKRSVSGCAQEDDEVEILEGQQDKMQSEKQEEDVEIVEDSKASTQDMEDDVEIVDEQRGTPDVTPTTTAPSSCCPTPSQSEDVDIVEIVGESSIDSQQTLVAPYEHLGYSYMGSRSAGALKQVLHDDDDEIEIIEVKKPSRKAAESVITASTVKPAAVSTPSVPRKAPGKENTLIGWLNVKEKPKERPGSQEKKPKALVMAKDKGDKARPRKKAKLDGGKGAGAGVLKGRPILQDLIGNEV